MYNITNIEIKEKINTIVTTMNNNGYSDVRNLMAYAMTKNVNYITRKNNIRQTITDIDLNHINEYLNGIYSDNFINDFFNEYLDYAINEYGENNTYVYLKHWINGVDNAITRKNGYRYLFSFDKSKVKNRINSLTNGNIKQYVNDYYQTKKNTKYGDNKIDITQELPVQEINNKLQLEKSAEIQEKENIPQTIKNGLENGIQNIVDSKIENSVPKQEILGEKPAEIQEKENIPQTIKNGLENGIQNIVDSKIENSVPKQEILGEKPAEIQEKENIPQTIKNEFENGTQNIVDSRMENSVSKKKILEEKIMKQPQNSFITDEKKSNIKNKLLSLSRDFNGNLDVFLEFNKKNKNLFKQQMNNNLLFYEPSKKSYDFIESLDNNLTDIDSIIYNLKREISEKQINRKLIEKYYNKIRDNYSSYSNQLDEINDILKEKYLPIKSCMEYYENFSIKMKDYIGNIKMLMGDISKDSNDNKYEQTIEESIKESINRNESALKIV